jgi:DNA-binding CsgD family transcriptional regulator/PAS domain-containing protein
MADDKHAEAEPSVKFDQLRRQAEAMLAQKQGPPDNRPADILDLIHELAIHQTELELQNEALQQAQSEFTDLHRRFERLYEFSPFGYLNIDPRGLIIRCNLSGVELLNRTRTKILFTGFSQFLTADSQPDYLAALRRASQSGEKQRLELRLGGRRGPSPPASKGRDRWVWAEILAERADSGEVIGYFLALADIGAKKEAESALARSERKYKQLFDAMVAGCAVLEIAAQEANGRVTDLRILEVNNSGQGLAGMTIGDAKGRTIRQLWPQTENFWFDYLDRVLRRGKPIEVEGFHGPIGRHFRVSAFRLDGRRLGITFIDISAHKQVEAKLEKAHSDLEMMIKERTAALSRANYELSREVKAREWAQQMLMEKSKELEIRSSHLKEANTALQVLLKQYDNERQKLEEKVVSNLNELTRPHLSQLAAGPLSPRQRRLLDAVGRSLDDITAPMSRRFIIQGSQLTPAETQVAGLIRQGKSTKEIAELMGVARSTIDYHRLNIRRKLKLTNRSVNLQSYLRSLS